MDRPASPGSPVLAGRFFTIAPFGKPKLSVHAPPNSHVKILTANVMVSGGGALESNSVKRVESS